MYLDIWDQNMSGCQHQTANSTVYSTGDLRENLDMMIINFNGPEKNSKILLKTFAKNMGIEPNFLELVKR